jgi:hypothetical protein
MQSGNAIQFGALFEGQYARRSGQADVVYDPARDLARLKDAGISAVLMQLYEAYSGTLFYDSKKFPQFRESSQRDYLRETLEAAQALDMQVWLWAAEKGTPLAGPIYEEFADCLEMDQTGHTLATWDHNFACQCINSRWRQFVLDVYEEVLTGYPGIGCIIVSDEVGYNDAAHWGGYCPRCVERFKAKYGQEPPRSADWDDKDGLWWSFIKERFTWWKDYVVELARTTKQLAPHVSTAIIMNWFAMTTVLKGIDPWDITRIPDIDILVSDLFFRVFEHDHPTYQAWVGSLMKAFAARSGKRVFLTSAAYRTVPPEDIVVGTLDLAANAEGVFYYNLRHICDRPANLEAIRSVSQVSRAVFESLPGAAPDPCAAILLPRYLWQDHYYRDSLHLLHESTGMYQCLTLAGVPARMVFEDQLSDLDRYALVVIPELFSVPDALAATLEKYARSGGVVWMSLQSAGGPRSESEARLWDVFAVKYHGQTPPLRSLNSQDPHLALPVYDWPVVQHQLFGGFPTVSHRRAYLGPAAHARVVLSGSDDAGRDYPLVVETQLGDGTAILSAESFGATFNSYMQKCAGHPSMWLARAMTLRNFLQEVILRKVGGKMPATVATTGNVATFWWKGDAGQAAWLVNHEYSDRQRVRLNFAARGEQVSTEVLYADKIRESRHGSSLAIEVEVEPSSMAVVIVKHGLSEASSRNQL